MRLGKRKSPTEEEKCPNCKEIATLEKTTLIEKLYVCPNRNCRIGMFSIKKETT